MNVPFGVGVKLFITLVTWILVSSWKVDTLDMPKRVIPVSAQLSTQAALELPNVFPFSDLAGVSIKILLNSSYILLQLQCSQILHEEKINEKQLSNFASQWTQLNLKFDGHGEEHCSQVARGPQNYKKGTQILN